MVFGGQRGLFVCPGQYAIAGESCHVKRCPKNDDMKHLAMLIHTLEILARERCVIAMLGQRYLGNWPSGRMVIACSFALQRLNQRWVKPREFRC
jgi:hypothetical protein